MIDFFAPGRMISGSKSAYTSRYPNNVVVFNGNLIGSTSGRKFWYGDLDLTKDSARLIQLAKDLGEGFYVLREMDARFESEANPKTEKAVALVNSEEIIFY